MNKILKIGSRGSPLALTQVEMVKAALAEKFPALQTETVIIKTSGDWNPADGETRLSTIDGGKGLFAKEIEKALLAGAIDCAVHSTKDMDSKTPDGLVLEHYLPRADARDVLLVSNAVKSGHDALPDDPRGNVHTRLEKLEAGRVDATMLAMAGLVRLGLEAHADYVLDEDDMLPAAGQGAVCIELRECDDDIIAIFNQINHGETQARVTAERGALKKLDGSCHTPIGAHATIAGDDLLLRLQVSSLGGATTILQQGVLSDWSSNDCAAFGTEVAAELKSKIPASMLDQSAEDSVVDPTLKSAP